jgi:hypothetical protein
VIGPAGVGVGVLVAVAVLVGVKVLVGVAVGVFVAVGVGVNVAVGVRVGLAMVNGKLVVGIVVPSNDTLTVSVYWPTVDGTVTPLGTTGEGDGFAQGGDVTGYSHVEDPLGTVGFVGFCDTTLPWESFTTQVRLLT